MSPRLFRMGLIISLLLAVLSGAFVFVARENVTAAERAVQLSDPAGPAGERLRRSQAFASKAWMGTALFGGVAALCLAGLLVTKKG
jgi:hypothetical protein